MDIFALLAFLAGLLGVSVLSRKDVRAKDALLLVGVGQKSATEWLRTTGFQVAIGGQPARFYPEMATGALLVVSADSPCKSCGGHRRRLLLEKALLDHPDFVADFCDDLACGRLHRSPEGPSACGWISLRLRDRATMTEGLAAIEAELMPLLDEQYRLRVRLETAERDHAAASSRLMAMNETPYGKMRLTPEIDRTYLRQRHREKIARREIVHLREDLEDLEQKLPPTFRGRAAPITPTDNERGRTP